MAKKRPGTGAPQTVAAVPDDEAPHELQFTASVATWMTLIIEKDPTLPFSSARCEGRSRGNPERRDLSLYGKDGKALVTGEVKLPYQKDGATAYNAAVVKDARRKAERAGVSYFFTWNVNECVLWQTAPAIDHPAAGLYYRSWKVVTISKGAHLTLSSTTDAIKRWLGQFLNELAKIVRGSLKVGFKPPDERFIEALESALTLPIRLTFEELESRYATNRGRADLDKWMRDDQGWTIAADPEGIRDSLERSAKFSCYALVNKLVFYEGLLKPYGAQLPKLNVPRHLDCGDDLRLHLEGFFSQAKQVTGNYETVFGEDHAGLGSRIPFYSDHATAYWRGLVNQIHEFDFSKLDYEIIGVIFERLISPAERHKYGQFYSRVEVVDLINSFCIRTGAESLLDPACGGGTFLVRAYARKRELAPERPHTAMLDELYGVDISPFASHLTTINLATRDLIQHENYPRIARSDFFDIRVRRPFISVPVHVKTKGLGTNQHRDIEIPLLDAIVGNPPYIRQEEIKSDNAKGNGHPKHGTKQYYRNLIRQETGADFSGRSDLHCYFWPHAATFLKPNGWLCLLTSSQWLDVEYGFKLQRWILSRFKLIAVLESLDEPWFVGARVATAVTILQECAESSEREANSVRFVQLRRPIAEILAHDGTSGGAMAVADELRDEILALTGNSRDERRRVRLVSQESLLRDGMALGKLMRGAADSEDDGEADPDDSEETGGGEYYGGKWGIYVRAPDLWFELVDRYGRMFAPLGEIATIRRGVTSGKDEFFYPRDCTDDCLSELTEPTAFEHEYGVPRQRVESGQVKLVRCGDGYGEIKPVEAAYLQPEVHSLMEVNGYTVGASDCSRLILLVGGSKPELRGTHVLRYLEWGESKGWHRGATCSARATAARGWYDLTGHARGALFWPKSQQYKHSAPSNREGLQANCNLYDITPRHDIAPDVLAGILNSTWVVLAKFQYGRPVGNEGNLKTEVVDVTMMPVPDPRAADAATTARVAAAYGRLRKRAAMQFLSARRMRRMALTKTGREAQLAGLSDLCELDMQDRRDLDDAVAQMIGVRSSRDRESLLDHLYAYLREFFEQVRQKEEKAIANKNTSKRKAAVSPAEIAAQVLLEIKDKHGHLLRPYAELVDLNEPFSTFDLPLDGVAELDHDMFASHGSVRFVKGKRLLALISTKAPAQAELISLIAGYGIRGLVRIPLNPDQCRSVRQRYESLLADRKRRVLTLICERTADPDLQDSIFVATNDLVLHAGG